MNIIVNFNVAVCNSNCSMSRSEFEKNKKICPYFPKLEGVKQTMEVSAELSDSPTDRVLHLE